MFTVYRVKKTTTGNKQSVKKINERKETQIGVSLHHRYIEPASHSQIEKTSGVHNV